MASGNYLSDRKQYVDIDNTFSDSSVKSNRFALPQGSNLGPLLFLIYINGIFTLQLNGVLLLFADDAVLIYFNTNIEALNKKIQEDLDTIAQWLASNKLTMNADKTKYMLFNVNPSIVINSNFNLTMCNNSWNK